MDRLPRPFPALQLLFLFNRVHKHLQTNSIAFLNILLVLTTVQLPYRLCQYLNHVLLHHDFVDLPLHIQALDMFIYGFQYK